MQKVVLVVVMALIFISCGAVNNEAENQTRVKIDYSVIPDSITNIVEGDITYFNYNQIKSEINGRFNFEYTDDPMWTLRYKSIDEVELLIKEAIVSKKTFKGHPDIEPGLIEVAFTDFEIELLKKVMNSKYYREYNIGTNKAYDKLMSISFYDSENKNYKRKVVEIFCDLDNKEVLIEE